MELTPEEQKIIAEHRRIELREVVVDLARNYHELFEVGPGRNAIANGLAHALHELDEFERNLTRTGADAPGAPESNDDSTDIESSADSED